jgi:hypothetical protein
MDGNILAFAEALTPEQIGAAECFRARRASSLQSLVSAGLGGPRCVRGTATLEKFCTPEIMQNLYERDCMQNLILNACAQRYNSDDEQNRSSSGSSSQRSLGSCSRAAFG